MVQDYQYLNKQTVKNNYLLPLILDIIKNTRTKKVFTKMDLRQRYNNVKIKEKDKWKVVFITLEGLFEPIVIFFGLSNLLAIFQAMINKLLRDLINTGKIAAFIDIIVRTESKEGHNKLVEEILKRMVENDLYVKPEKCRQKVTEINFLEVVIRLEGIKMEEEKVKVVLDWPVPKSVKDIQKFLGLANYYKRFVEGFAKIARLLYELTKKEQKWEYEIR